MPAPTVTFGEIMLRLTPPGFERLLQSPTLHATFGGGEANVAASLAGFGLPAAFVTILPQANPLADAAIGELRRFGVDTSHIARSAGRMGIYFLETGASQRGSRVVYDRAGSAFALAVGEHRLAARAGRRRMVSRHGHHARRQRGGGESRARGRAHRARHGHHGVVRSEFSEESLEVGQARVRGDARARQLSDILIANEEDIQMALGLAADVDVHAGALDRASYRRADRSRDARVRPSERRSP